MQRKTKMESTTSSSSGSALPAVAAEASAEDAGGRNGGVDRLQRHRSLHSPKVQSRNIRQKFDNNNKSTSSHRRATSVRVRPTYLLEDEDPSLPKPPVSISVACPEDEVEESVTTLGHRYIFG